MKLTMCFALLSLAIACNPRPSPQSASRAVPRARDATLCDPSCAAGQVCAETGECGEGCGLDCATDDPASCVPGSVVCVGGDVCMLGNDCAPPCRVGGAIWTYSNPSDCSLFGLRGLQHDATKCFAPCWYPLCTALGGSC